MIYFLIPLLIFIDLISKLLAKIYLNGQINLIGDFIYLKYIENIGIAFSIQLTGNILKISTIIITAYLTYYYFTEEKNKKNKLVDTSFALIFSGAIGNGYERIFNSKVIDFIGVKYFSIFNLADAFITIGVILYLINLFIYNKKNVLQG